MISSFPRSVSAPLALEEGLVSPWRAEPGGSLSRTLMDARGAPVSPAGPSAPAQLSSFCPLKRGTELRPELRHIQAGCGSHRVPPSGSHWLALTGGWGSLALPPALGSQGLDRACRSLLSASQQAETSAPEATRCDAVCFKSFPTSAPH